ncbi:LCP family protein [Corynebacterium sp. CNCTC7651]|uniref:LCP family protein n=1 Tax=Corynebacterium sp. CNCTC7651 TaxID=2815361 RepID=UPI001F468ADD|nr:LCP family protein [Corynebacterium sp. CNCTC7651]UIZ92611.1 LCP family protein [Corynebacterium sp. CNCTC7651]
MTDNYRRARDIQPAPSRVRDVSQAGHPVVKGVLAFLSAAVLVTSGVGYLAVGRIGDQLSASELELKPPSKSKEKKSEETLDGAVDILLVGSDSRTDAQGQPLSEEELARLNAGIADGEVNTDTIMVVRIPADGSRATAVSIPRDTYVHTEEYGNLKINGVYGAHAAEKREELVERGMAPGQQMEQQVARAGQEGLIQAVADLTGVEVDHFAQVGLLGFVLLTDAVGGVEVCLNEAVNEPLSGANFPAGVQTLDGAQALSFVRQRHDLPRGDLDRIVRQQAYMASLVRKMLSAGTLANPARLRDLANAAERSVTIDQGWDVMGLAQQMSGLAGGNVTFTTIPVTSVNGVGDYGESIVTVDVAEVHRFMADQLAQEEDAEDADATPTDGALPELSAALTAAEAYVLNSEAPPRQATAVAGFLTDAGMTVANVSNAMEGVYSRSQIVAANPEDPAALELAELLGGLPVTANDGLEPNSLIVVVAADYMGPAAFEDGAGQDGAGDEVEQPNVGTPGSDFGATDAAPELNAGGTGPRCVN